jgi:hypothetical protein
MSSATSAPHCGQKRRVMGRPLALAAVCAAGSVPVYAKPSVRSHDSATAPPPEVRWQSRQWHL